MADHAKPILTDNYTDVLSQIRGRFEDQAKGFDPANTTATNITTGTIRWNSAEKKFQKWSGTAWGDLTDNYVLSGATFSPGTANGVAYLNGSKVLTTGSALTFDGTNFATTGKVTAAGTVLSAFGAGTSGTNLELGFDGTQSIVQSYNRTGSAYAPLWLEGSYTRFGSGGSERMRLDSSGNLGIGTSSPAAKLHVVGNQYRQNDSTGSFGFTLNTTSATTTLATLFGGSSFAIQTAGSGTNQLLLDASGNLGLGVTPSAWSASAKAFQVGAYSALYQNASGYPELAFNTYQNTSNTYTYLNTDVATRYSQTNGQHRWYTAPSGTAGSTISFTQAMTLDANGNLGIGTSSPSGKLDVAGTIRGILNNGQGGQSLIGAVNAVSNGYEVNVTASNVYTYRWHNSSGTVSMTLDNAGKLILSAANQGIQFADGTTQTTAAVSATVANVGNAIANQEVGAVGTYAMLKFVGSGGVLDGSTVSGTNLRYTNAAGTTTDSGGFPTGTWKAMGFVQTTSDATRTTLWLRIS